MTNPTGGTEQFIETARGYVETNGGNGADHLPPCDELADDQLKSLVGTEEAANLRVPKVQLDEGSVDVGANR